MEKVVVYQIRDYGMLVGFRSCVLGGMLVQYLCIEEAITKAAMDAIGLCRLLFAVTIGLSRIFYTVGLAFHGAQMCCPRRSVPIISPSSKRKIFDYQPIRFLKSSSLDRAGDICTMRHVFQIRAVYRSLVDRDRSLPLLQTRACPRSSSCNHCLPPARSRNRSLTIIAI